jgi:hypothetical protein
VSCAVASGGVDEAASGAVGFAGGNRSISARGFDAERAVSVFAEMGGASNAASAADAAASAADAEGGRDEALSGDCGARVELGRPRSVSSVSSGGVGFGARSSTIFGCILAPTASVPPTFVAQFVLPRHICSDSAHELRILLRFKPLIA